MLIGYLLENSLNSLELGNRLQYRPPLVSFKSLATPFRAVRILRLGLGLMDLRYSCIQYTPIYNRTSYKSFVLPLLISSSSMDVSLKLESVYEHTSTTLVTKSKSLPTFPYPLLTLLTGIESSRMGNET